MTNNSLPLSKKKDRISYQTFDFINDLLRELQNHPELLAKMFPTRVVQKKKKKNILSVNYRNLIYKSYKFIK